jgi:N-sulfoglucosamine sulfohydrolase
MLKLLEETKKADDTLVIFLSDNGIPFPGAKTTLYDPGLNLPLIVASPAQQKRGVVNEAMVSWVDVLPTILDWAGVKAPPVLAGRSLLPILDQERPKGWDEVYGSHQFHEITVS